MAAATKPTAKKPSATAGKTKASATKKKAAAAKTPNAAAKKKRAAPKKELGPITGPFIQRVRQMRMLNGMTRNELADRTEVLAKGAPDSYVPISRSSFQKIEDGFVKSVTIDQAVTLCAVLNNYLATMLFDSSKISGSAKDVADNVFERLKDLTEAEKEFALAVRIVNLPQTAVPAVYSLIRELERGQENTAEQKSEVERLQTELASEKAKLKKVRAQLREAKTQ